jgi:hypothetical protein
MASPTKAHQRSTSVSCSNNTEIAGAAGFGGGAGEADLGNDTADVAGAPADEKVTDKMPQGDRRVGPALGPHADPDFGAGEGAACGTDLAASA